LTLLTLLFLSQDFGIAPSGVSPPNGASLLRAAVRLCTSRCCSDYWLRGRRISHGYRHHLIPVQNHDVRGPVVYQRALRLYRSEGGSRHRAPLCFLRLVARATTASSSSPPRDSKRAGTRATAVAATWSRPFAPLLLPHRFRLAALFLSQRGLWLRRERLITASARRIPRQFAAALDGMTIVQLSDITSVAARAARMSPRVDMANALGADLAVVTETSSRSCGPLADCVDEIANFAHPSYFRLQRQPRNLRRGQDAAQELFARAGMKLLAMKSAARVSGRVFNLLGVDYQRERAHSGQRLEMLPTWSLVHRTCQTFCSRKSKLLIVRGAGIELSLAGTPTAGKSRWKSRSSLQSGALYHDYIAGAYFRRSPCRDKPPCAEGGKLFEPTGADIHHAQPPSQVYVNAD